MNGLNSDSGFVLPPGAYLGAMIGLFFAYITTAVTMYIVETISRECCQPQDLLPHPEAKVIGGWPLHKVCKWCQLEHVLMNGPHGWHYVQLDRDKWVAQAEGYYEGLEPKTYWFSPKDYYVQLDLGKIEWNGFETATTATTPEAIGGYYQYSSPDYQALKQALAEKQKLYQESKQKFMNQLKGWYSEDSNGPEEIEELNKVTLKEISQKYWKGITE